jgi:ATP-dependent Clp protease adapter protein ClpS
MKMVDNGVAIALGAVGAMVGVCLLKKRGSMKLEPKKGDGTGFDLKDLLGMAEEPAEPPMCDIWLLNGDNVDGHFVERMLMEVFGFDRRRAMQTGFSAHNNGRAHVVTMGCVEAREKLAQANGLARREHPPAVNVLDVQEK